MPRVGFDTSSRVASNDPIGASSSSTPSSTSSRAVTARMVLLILATRNWSEGSAASPAMRRPYAAWCWSSPLRSTATDAAAEPPRMSVTSRYWSTAAQPLSGTTLPTGVGTSVAAAAFGTDVVDVVAGALDVGALVVLGAGVGLDVTSTKAGPAPDWTSAVVHADAATARPTTTAPASFMGRRLRHCCTFQ